MGALDGLGLRAQQRGRRGRLAKAHAVLAREQLLQMSGGGAVAAGVEHPREQLLGGLAGFDVEQLLVLLAGDHQPRLELQQRGDEHDEFGRGLQVELAARFEVVEVGEHDVGELELEQVDLLAQDQRQQQVEGPAEQVEVELEVGDAHAVTVAAGPDGELPDASAHALARTRQVDGGRRLTAGGRGAARRADAHALAHVGERLRGDRARVLATGGEDVLQRGLVGAQLLVALAHGGEELDHGARDGALQLSVARLRELGFD